MDKRTKEIRRLKDSEYNLASKIENIDQEAILLEKKILDNPNDIQARKVLLDIYFLRLYRDKEQSRLKGRSIIEWFISNHPEEKMLWQQATIFYLPVDKNRDSLIKLWERKVQESNNNAQVIRNAAQFFINLDNVFSEALWKRLTEMDPYDVEAIELRAKTLSWITKRILKREINY